MRDGSVTGFIPLLASGEQYPDLNESGVQWLFVLLNMKRNAAGYGTVLFPDSVLPGNCSFKSRPRPLASYYCAVEIAFHLPMVAMFSTGTFKKSCKASPVLAELSLWRPQKYSACMSSVIAKIRWSSSGNPRQSSGRMDQLGPIIRRHPTPSGGVRHHVPHYLSGLRLLETS